MHWVQSALGQGCGLGKLKQILRTVGERGEAAARRVGRLSRTRNALAHPETMLKEEVVELLRGNLMVPSERPNLGYLRQTIGMMSGTP